MTTKIEWCDETWNPVTGCTPISEGCQNCYAERMAKRLAGRFGYPADDPFRPGTYHEDKFIQPTRWRKPRRIFVCSMGDIFHEDVPDWLINKVSAMMAHPMSGGAHHTYMLLTKRPERLFVIGGRPEHFKDWPNIWLGVTAENQARADERARTLIKVPAAVRFLSVEPILERIDLFQAGAFVGGPCGGGGDSGPVEYDVTANIDWVICGPETGPGARPFQYDWARDLRDQCRAVGVPFFYKKHDHQDTPEDLRIAELPKGRRT